MDRPYMGRSNHNRKRNLALAEGKRPLDHAAVIRWRPSSLDDAFGGTMAFARRDKSAR
jgi:hypothetical protein